MRKNLKPKAYIYPLPVLIVGTYDENDNANAMNAVWGTVYNATQVFIRLDSRRKTVKNILARKAFTVSIADDKNVAFADYVGVVSSNDVPDKLKKTGWTAKKSEFVDAPVFDQLPLCLECILVSYDPAAETCIGEVVSVSADENIVNENGQIDLTKFKPICYDCGTRGYYTLGDKVGQAFSDGLKIKDSNP